MGSAPDLASLAGRSICTKEVRGGTRRTTGCWRCPGCRPKSRVVQALTVDDDPTRLGLRIGAERRQREDQRQGGAECVNSLAHGTRGMHGFHALGFAPGALCSGSFGSAPGCAAAHRKRTTSRAARNGASARRRRAAPRPESRSRAGARCAPRTRQTRSSKASFLPLLPVHGRTVGARPFHERFAALAARTSLAQPLRRRGCRRQPARP